MKRSDLDPNCGEMLLLGNGDITDR